MLVFWGGRLLREKNICYETATVGLENAIYSAIDFFTMTYSHPHENQATAT
jgi:hypothetical protein